MRRFFIIFVLFCAATIHAQTTYSSFVDFEGGTNGVAPTPTTLAASSHGSLTWPSQGNAHAGLIFATAGQLSSFPSSITVGASNYDGSGSLGLQGTTDTSGHNIGFNQNTFTNTTHTSVAEAFYVKWSCPANQFLDCGALGGLITSSNKYAVLHIEPPGFSGTGCSAGGSHIPNALLETGDPSLSCIQLPSVNTVYLINILQTGGGAGTSKLTVCNASGTTVYGSVTQLNEVNDSSYTTQTWIGVTGEEPTTAGYTYEWDDAAVDLTGSNFSTISCFPPVGTPAPACTTASCTASDCTYASVFDALPTSGNTNPTVVVNIPACTATTWTSNLSYTQPSAVTNLTIQGAGTPNIGTATFGAGTLTSTITDNAGTSFPLLNLELTYGQTLTVQNLNILPLTGGTSLVAPFWVIGSCTSSGCPNFRANNIAFGNGTTQWTTSGNGSSASAMMAAANVYGVVDHNTLPAGSDVRLIDVHHPAWLGTGQYGDNSWAQVDTFGTASAFFIENNLVSSIIYPFTDTELQPENLGTDRGGGRVVVRYNHYTTGSGIMCTNHGTEGGAGRARGARQLECYNNTMTCTSGCSQGITLLRGGALLQFGNTAVVSGGTFGSYVNLYEARRASGGNPWGFGAGTGPYDQNTGTVFASGTATGGSVSTLVDSGQTWTTNQWQLAGSPYSVWDVTQSCGAEIISNTATTLTLLNSASACTPVSTDSYQILQATILIDQPTSGQGVYLAGTSAPGLGPTPIQFPNNALDPIYKWNDTTSGGTTSNDVVGDVGDISFIANRDYYAQASGIQTTSSSPFNGTSGTGWGTLAHRPSTCTTGVGYADTVTNANYPTLYKCTSTNTWTASYMPYTYPHPLEGIANGSITTLDTILTPVTVMQ